MSSRTRLLIPTKGPKRADYHCIGHQQGILLHLRKEKETLKNMVMYVSMLIWVFFFGLVCFLNSSRLTLQIKKGSFYVLFYLKCLQLLT